MIQLIKDVIVRELPELVDGNVEGLSFLKVSTPTSGGNLWDKVIFLVFKKNAAEPFLCIKTVRNYGAKKVIERNYQNLKMLNEAVENSPYERMFANALCLHDDGENIFYIETACPGRRIKLNRRNITLIVSKYIDFQEYVSKGKPLVNIRTFMKEILERSGLSQTAQKGVQEFIASLSLENISLPRLIQHGDVTEDNIVFTKDGIAIIDYDFADVTDLPGADLFGLFNRYRGNERQELRDAYFLEYFSRIGAQLKSNDHRKLFFLYYLIDRVLRKPQRHIEDLSAREIISDFEKNVQ